MTLYFKNWLEPKIRFFLFPLTEDDVRQKKIKKSAKNGIPSYIIKSCADILALLPTYLFNLSIAIGEFLKSLPRCLGRNHAYAPTSYQPTTIDK